MHGIVNRSDWKAMVLAAAAMVAGCENAATEIRGGARLLTGIEMDQVTVGSAMAVSEVKAHALGFAPQTNAFTSTLADSSGSPIAGAPFISYASSQAVASASNGSFVQLSGSIRIKVDDGNGGARIDSAASATGGDMSHVEVNIHLTGISLSHLDLVYGSVSAAACCNTLGTAQAQVDSAAGGPYMSQLLGAPVSDIPGQVESRIDAAVASSARPLLDAGQALTVTAPRLWQSINQ